MSQALYRRYRPETFAEVIGQDHVTQPLRQALRNGRVHHAYLFSGPRGCGKTTSARILARSLNCEQGPTPDPCGTCRSCTDLARGGPGNIDVIEIDAASHGGVDDARELREKAFFAPASSRYKIYIIDEAHMVSSAGFNALLKLVEEPPEHVKFVFATTEPDKVIGTIRSRTHHYPFRLIPPTELHSYLATLCEREGVTVGKGVLPLVVRAGRGSARDALSVLDQLLGGAGPDGVTYRLAADLLGFTDAALLDDAVESFAAADAAAVFGVVNRVVEGGLDPRRFAEDLLERLRDLLILDAAPEAATTILGEVPEDQLERMRQQATRFGPAQLSRAADLVNAGLLEMRGATAPRLQLELICARILLPAASGDESSLAARLERLERRLALGGAVTATVPTPPSRSPSGPDPEVAPTGEPEPDVVPAPPTRPEPGRPAWPDAPEVPSPADVPARAGRSTQRAAGPSTERQAVRRDAPAVDQPQGRTGQPTAPVEDDASPPPGDAVPGGVDLSAVRRAWPDVLARLFALKRTTWTLVKDNAVVAAFEPGRLTLALSTVGLRDRFARPPHPELVRQALIEELALDVQVDAIVDPSASGGAPTPTGGATSTPAGASVPARGHGAPAPRQQTSEASGWDVRTASSAPPGGGAVGTTAPGGAGVAPGGGVVAPGGG
ncbi:MAG: DNA polymerase III subunit gamma and tau, partial [Actinomycetota bacterium]|nr:DNA polymerase III subunit gamma and tau [Actinomycetota bacterium]